MQGNPNQPYQGGWQQGGMDPQYPFQQTGQYPPVQPQYSDMYAQATGQYAPVQPQYPDMYAQATGQYAPVQPQYPDMYAQATGQYAPVQPQYPDMYAQATGQYAPVQPQYPDMYAQATGQYAPVQPQYPDMFGQTQQYAPVHPQQNMYQQYNSGQYQDLFQQQTAQYAPVRGQMTQEQMWQLQQMQSEPLHPNMFNQQGKPKRKKKQKGPRRPGASPWKKGLIIAVVLALLGAGAFYIIQNMGKGRATTATVEASTVGTSYRGDALIVRNEVAYDEEGVQNIDYVAQEGSLVSPGEVLCYVYSTGYSISEMQTLQDYRDQITDFEQSLLGGETAYDQRMERLESDVISRGLEVRSLVQGARGNMIQQEQILDDAIVQRQNYFRTKYSEEPRLSRLFDDEATQTQRIESWIKQKSCNQQGSIVSFYTDGYEYALSPSNYESYTPTQVRNMINGQKPESTAASRGRTTLYRLVKKQDYVVLMLVKDSTWTPKDGDTYKLVLEQFSSTVVDARVLSSTRTGDELLVRLAIMGDVTDVLYMRTCSAELGKHVDCLKVPKSALYTQNGNTGVVIVTEEGQFFIPVNVMNQDATSAYIAAIQTGQLTPGMTVQLFD